ncbi:30S ribosomal protein S9, mitochondrial [Actinidia eriantha]|uniref:30S ribosomal protein S9, mitochondrial n=1 Tax=Actinidia eriantha TaxID=165200 RepID=UPI0025851E99|nr:30S ribosomal protein S9, mitochondrial [Actinidia eriantha]
MLARFLTRSSHLRLLTLISSQNHFSNPKPHHFHNSLPPIPNPSPNFPSVVPRFFSSNQNNDGGNKDQRSLNADFWKISTEEDSVFGDDAGTLEGISGGDAKPEEDSWLSASAEGADTVDDIFKGVEKSEIGGGGDDWTTADGYKPWTLVEEDKGDQVFDFGEEVSEMRSGGDERVEIEKSEEDRKLEEEEKVLSAVLQGPNRAFGDLVAASGITEAMLDSLIALKDMESVQGLPPLREIEDMRYEKNTRKSSRAEIERQKQEEVAKSRVREVDEKGRAYGTGRRKCSIARVWIQPGDGKFLVNDKEFDVYFRMLDHRAALLRPFSETKTLGLWDISCTVKGGGLSGQVGAVQLGISRALQNWEPDLRPPLRAAGFLTRDARVVERKKPGKAKARKSFQWVKR